MRLNPCVQALNNDVKHMQNVVSEIKSSQQTLTKCKTLNGALGNSSKLEESSNTLSNFGTSGALTNKWKFKNTYTSKHSDAENKKNKNSIQIAMNSEEITVPNKPNYFPETNFDNDIDALLEEENEIKTIPDEDDIVIVEKTPLKSFENAKKSRIIISDDEDEDFDQPVIEERDRMFDDSIDNIEETTTVISHLNKNDNDELDDLTIADFDQLEDDFEDIDASPNQEEDGFDPDYVAPDKQYINVLKEYFGHSKFRPMQWKIINTVLNEGRDQCVVMATGYGKSLCYQFPPVYLNTTAICISPLISLMEDQVLKLQTNNIPACFFGSAQTDKQVYGEAKKGNYRVVYITPEFVDVATDMLVEMQRNVGISLIAIDEAHCVSQWGHDFRDSYRNLGVLKKELPGVPILAVTATATPEVRKDICSSLGLRSPIITTTSFDRANLYLDVHSKSGSPEDDLRSVMRQKKGFGSLKYEFNGPTIIYCPTKKETVKIGNVVKGLGVKCSIYHAGLSPQRRKVAHHKFVRDELQCIIATVAFGMGIDKPDVRQIIHYGAPKDIESYYQEIGRAGRDGDPAICHVFFASGDFVTSRFFLKDISSAKFRDHKAAMIRKMENYLTTTSCRRRSVLLHFDKQAGSSIYNTSKCCDNCNRRLKNNNGKFGDRDDTEPIDALVDYGDSAKKLFETLQITKEKFGLGMPKSKKVYERFQKHPQFGFGAEHTVKWWKALGKALLNEGYLQEKQNRQGSMGAIVQIAQKGRAWMGKRNFSPSFPLKLTPTVDLLEKKSGLIVTASQKSSETADLSTKLLSTVKSKEYTQEMLNKLILGPYIYEKKTISKTSKKLSENDEHSGPLYALLLSLRNNIAHDMDIPPHLVANNKDLLELAKVRPSNKEKIMKVDGMSAIKVKRMGDQVLAVIQSYCEEHEASYDNFSHDATLDIMGTHSGSIKREKNETGITPKSLSETATHTYKLFHDKGFTLEEISKERGLQISTMGSHLSDALAAGHPVCFERLGITEAMIKMLEDAIRNPPINNDLSSLSAIKDRVGSSMDWVQLKLVKVFLTLKYGITHAMKSVSLNPSSLQPVKPQFSTKPKKNSFQQPVVKTRDYFQQSENNHSSRQPKFLTPSIATTAERRKNLNTQSRQFLTNANKVDSPIGSPQTSLFTPEKTSPFNKTKTSEGGKRKLPPWAKKGGYKFKRAKK